jgi:hypothetical protein
VVGEGSAEAEQPEQIACRPASRAVMPDMSVTSSIIEVCRATRGFQMVVFTVSTKFKDD